MIITPSTHLRTPSVNKLIEIWGQRYIPNVPYVPGTREFDSFQQQLILGASLEQRQKTAAKLTRQVIATKCQMASLRAKMLYSYVPEVFNLNEALRLSDCILLVYLKLAEIYQQPLPTETQIDRQGCAMMIPVDQLAMELEPILMECQQQHIVAEDWRTLGFLTTLVNFSNELLLNGFSAVERSLIYPYFQFIEEQVALPWQRVCFAAANYPLEHPKFALVEQCLGQSQAIAHRVYELSVERFPFYKSRRGPLRDEKIKHSSIRDMQMFQAYFWLSFLENSDRCIEEELVPLCAMVYPGIGVSWELIEAANEILLQQIQDVLRPDQIDMLRPFMEGYRQSFVRRKSEFQGATIKKSSTANEGSEVASQNVLNHLKRKINTTLPTAVVSTTNGEAPESVSVSLQSSEGERLREKIAQLEAELAQLSNRNSIEDIYPTPQ